MRLRPWNSSGQVQATGWPIPSDAAAWVNRAAGAKPWSDGKNVKLGHNVVSSAAGGHAGH